MYVHIRAINQHNNIALITCISLFFEYFYWPNTQAVGDCISEGIFGYSCLCNLSLLLMIVSPFIQLGI